jgi:DNA repair exonuclease SbcCD ATPase subunit
MGLSHKIEFTHEMTVNISLIGRSLSFGNFSAGQRARVNISLSLAFRDMLQQTHANVNVFMLDEILDVGLDSVGIMAATTLIKQKAKDDNNSLFVISHRDECANMFDNKLTVEMQKGFSYIR